REILHKLAADYGLGKGDLVFTGTPSGVGAIGAGDNLALELDGLVRASFTVGC
ncbi:TPA: fumarylacetoacetate hydrolase family protein, partial [Neisseria meningitidis]